jgi:hypothetical protein
MAARSLASRRAASASRVGSWHARGVRYPPRDASRAPRPGGRTQTCSNRRRFPS